MKENCSFKRFDLFSVLAAVGIVGALLFESFFMFELYEIELRRSVCVAPSEPRAPAVAPQSPPAVPAEIAPVG